MAGAAANLRSRPTTVRTGPPLEPQPPFVSVFAGVEVSPGSYRRNWGLLSILSRQGAMRGWPASSWYLKDGCFCPIRKREDGKVNDHRQDD